MTALLQYSMVLHSLLDPAYSATGYHSRWAACLRAAIAAQGHAAITAAQQLAPQPPDRAEVAAQWRSLQLGLDLAGSRTEQLLGAHRAASGHAQQHAAWTLLTSRLQRQQEREQRERQDASGSAAGELSASVRAVCVRLLEEVEALEGAWEAGGAADEAAARVLSGDSDERRIGAAAMLEAALHKLTVSRCRALT
jgi:hypothetical protein